MESGVVPTATSTSASPPASSQLTTSAPAPSPSTTTSATSVTAGAYRARTAAAVARCRRRWRVTSAAMTTWCRALVTGASSGIGQAFARRLARDGADLVVVARRTERLERLAGELRERHGVAVEVVTADLTDRSALARVEARASARADPIDLLVNNAGAATYGPFAALDPAQMTDEIALNVIAVVRLTRAALPGMLSRRRGGVVNVSSVSSMVVLPTLTVYSASKSFVTVFSEGLAEEVHGTGVSVLAVCPGTTPTESGPRMGLGNARGPFLTSPDHVADVALRALGRGKVVVVPGPVNDLLVRGSRVVPRSLLRRGMGLAARL